jgi:hypothetical protein
VDKNSPARLALWVCRREGVVRTDQLNQTQVISVAHWHLL